MNPSLTNLNTQSNGGALMNTIRPLQKQSIRILLLLTPALLLLTAGCTKSFLDIKPKGELIAQSVNDYDNLLNNGTLVNVPASAGPAMAQIPMGDETVSVDPYFTNTDLRTQRLFRWDDVVYDPGQDALEMTDLMPQLYTYNKIANEVLDAPDGTLPQKQALKAEALANRAWTYLLLANYYGKPYNPATAATDLCFPIITEADVTATKFDRATVKACYDFMVSDLTAAIPALPKETSSRARMCRSAAEGLLGKVYLFMGRYSDALSQFNTALADLPVNMPVAFSDLNQTMAVGGSLGYNPFITPLTLLAGVTGWTNTENLFCRQFLNYWTTLQNDILLSPAAASLYQPSDQRLKFYGPFAFGGGSFIMPGALRRVGPGTVQFGLMLPDVYLMRAECEARSGDLANANADLTTLRTNRMAPADATVNINDQDSLIRFVINERTREFAIQGYRWFDMRRLSVDPLFSNTVYTHQFMSAAGTITTYTLKPERLTMRFAQKIIDQNPGMQNNP